MTDRFTTLLSRDKLTEQERHELAVIDAAVRGAGTEQPEDAALTDFALRISAVRALPNDGFYRELDERFGLDDSATSAAPAPTRAGRTRLLTVGGGSLASVLLVLVVVAGVATINGKDATTPDRATSSAGVRAPQSTATTQSDADASATADRASSGEARATAPEAAVAPSAGGTAKSVAPSDGAPPSAAPGASRKVARTGDLVLATPGSNVETVADSVIRITDKFGGYVGDSTVTGGEAANASANFDLQVPAAKFQAALAEYSKLAHVRSRTQNTQDVTAPYSRSRSRLNVARAQRDRLLSQYAAAQPGSREAAALKTRLARAEARLDARRAELARLQNRVNYVGLTVGVVADGSAVAEDSRGTIHRAADTAVNALTAIAAVLLIVLAVALPFALVGGIGWLATKRVRRNRRDAALAATVSEL